MMNREEADKKAYEDIGNILDGIPLGSALNIITAIVYGATIHLPSEDRSRIAEMFNQILTAKKGIIQ
jgi:hypothetical protein